MSIGTLISSLTLAGDRTGRPTPTSFTETATSLAMPMEHRSRGYRTRPARSTSPRPEGDARLLQQAGLRLHGLPPQDDELREYDRRAGRGGEGWGDAAHLPRTGAGGRQRLQLRRDRLRPGRHRRPEERFVNERVAIIGGGGTGGYIREFVGKTPVREIRLFDSDEFLTHNAFRAPGAPSLEELREAPNKVEYLKRIYSRMHRNIVPHDVELGADNLHLLDGVTFAFLSLDAGDAKRSIVEKLEAIGASFRRAHPRAPRRGHSLCFDGVCDIGAQLLLRLRRRGDRALHADGLEDDVRR